jgi:hypothetical protein
MVLNWLKEVYRLVANFFKQIGGFFKESFDKAKNYFF